MGILKSNNINGPFNPLESIHPKRPFKIGDKVTEKGTSKYMFKNGRYGKLIGITHDDWYLVDGIEHGHNGIPDANRLVEGAFTGNGDCYYYRAEDLVLFEGDTFAELSNLPIYAFKVGDEVGALDLNGDMQKGIIIGITDDNYYLVRGIDKQHAGIFATYVEGGPSGKDDSHFYRNNQLNILAKSGDKSEEQVSVPLIKYNKKNNLLDIKIKTNPKLNINI